MKKGTTKILMAALALFMAIGLATGSTFAWFSLNNKVAVTGMHVTTRVSNNILIAPSTTAATAKEADNAFKTNYIATSNTVLEPVSTVNGLKFFYNSTANVNAAGDAVADSYVAYDPADTDDFNENYGLAASTAVGYVDYAFQIKATNTDTANSAKVRLTNLDLLYNGTSATQKAFRVAMFVCDMGETGATAALDLTDLSTADKVTAAAAKLVTILAPTSAAYFTSNSAISAVNAAPTAIGAKLSVAAEIGTLAAKKTNFYKVVIRLWLEGEDNTCNNTTFADLTSDWALNLNIQLVKNADLEAVGKTPVSVLGNTATSASKIEVAAGGKLDADDTNWIVIDGVTYKPLLDSSDDPINATSPATQVYSSEAVSNTMKLYTIADNKYLTDVTTQFDLTNWTPAP